MKPVHDGDRPGAWREEMSVIIGRPFTRAQPEQSTRVATRATVRMRLQCRAHRTLRKTRCARGPARAIAGGLGHSHTGQVATSGRSGWFLPRRPAVDGVAALVRRAAFTQSLIPL